MKNKTKRTGRLILVATFLALILFLAPFAAAESIPLATNTPVQALTPFSYYGEAAQYYFPSYSQQQCEAGQDFFLEIPPLSCSPQIVRSDLLEEQDVPVFCRLVGTKLNPVIEVPHIKSIAIAQEEQNSDIKTVLFHQARAGLQSTYSSLVGSPALNDLGYLVVVLKKKATEKEMPDIVTANLTTKITYIVEKSFGIADNQLLLPVLTDDEWKSQYKKYGFWKGKGYVRAESVDVGKVNIKMYSDASTVFDTFALKKDDIILPRYMPGFYCSAGYKIKLEDIEYPQIRAEIYVDGDKYIATKGMLVGDTGCKVTKILLSATGIGGSVTLSCPDGVHTLVRGAGDEVKLSVGVNDLSPKILSYVIGDEIRLGDMGGQNSGLMFVYSAKIPSAEGKARDIAVLAQIENGAKAGDIIKETRKKLKEFMDDNADELSRMSNANVNDEFEQLLLGVKKDKTGGFWKQITARLGITGNLEFFVILNKETIELKNPNQEVEIEIVEIKGLTNKIYDVIVEDYYKEAINAYKEVAENYPSLNDANGVPYGAKALYEAAKKANELNKTEDKAKFLREITDKYTNSGIADDARKELADICNLIDTTGATKYIESEGKIYAFTLGDVIEPSSDELSVDLSIDEGSVKNFGLNDEIDNGWQISEIKEDRVRFINQSEKIDIKEGESRVFGGSKIMAVKINLKKFAYVSIEPWSNKGVTYANFTFSIGIEKRAIQLNPDQTRGMIENIDKEMKKWEDAYNNLNKVVKQWKNVCLAGAGTLWLINAIDNLKTAKTIARREVMRGTAGQPGMIQICDDLVSGGEYPSTRLCLQDKQDEINSRMAAIEEVIKNYNDVVVDIENRATSELEKAGIFGETVEVLNRSKFSEIMQFEVFSTSERGYWTNSSYKNKLSSEEIANLEKEGKPIYYIFLDDIVYKDVNGKNRTITKNEVGGILGSTSLLYKEGYFYSADQKELYELLELRDKCNQGTLSGDYCKNINDAFGRKLQTLINFRRNLDKEKTLLEEINSEYNINLEYVDVVESEKKLKLTAQIERLQKAEIINNSDVSGIFDNDEGVVNVAFFYFNDVKYMATADSIGGTDFKIKNLFKLNEKNRIIEDMSDGFPAGLSSIITGISKENCCASSRYLGKKTIRFWESGSYNGLPAFMPVTDIKQGFYVLTPLSYGFGLNAYHDSGKIANFWLCGVGPNGKPDFDFSTGPRGDDAGCCMLMNQNTPVTDHAKWMGITQRDIDQIYGCVGEAAQIYKAGKRNVGVSCCKDCTIGEPAISSPTATCEDFMSPSDCNILFNLCDPVVCPRSRCDLGGKYPVDDVIQTGIVGGFTLCLPNAAKENIAIPFCLTGILAGMDNVVTIMKSAKTCLNESLATGKTIGICDQLRSVYLCEYFWRELTPILKVGIPNLMEKGFVGGIFGTRKTGGEYMTFTDSWNSALNSFNYVTSYYGEEIFRAFTIRSMAEAGSMICKQFISIAYPDQANIVDELTEPESPYQLSAFFYETPMTTATVPAMSQYKVYYHIYAGRDEGHYYMIYLRQTGISGYYQTPEIYPVPGASGYLARGEYVDLTPDFTAPAGYKEICVRIDSKDECGFGKATTNMGVQEITDYYASEQSAEEISTAEECVSGTAGYIAPNLNIQQIVEETLNPEIYKRGITRICSSQNPGTGTDPGRWTRVGFCDIDRKISCWLDENSVKSSIKDLGLENKTLSEAKDIAKKLFDETGLMSKEQSEELFNQVESRMKPEMRTKLKGLKLYEKSKDSSELKKQVSEIINPVIEKLNYIIEKSSFGSEDYRARSQLQIGAVYNDVVMNLIPAKEKDAGKEEAAENETGEIEPLTEAEEKELGKLLEWTEPEEKEMIETFVPESLYITFDFDSPVVSEENMKKIEDAIKATAFKKNSQIIIEGYASMEGLEEHNQDLSEKRADAVKSIIEPLVKDQNVGVVVYGKGVTSVFSEAVGASKSEEVYASIEAQKFGSDERNKIVQENEGLLREDRRAVITYQSVKLVEAGEKKEEETGCELTHADWNKLEAVEGDEVKLFVYGDENCENEELVFAIKEKDTAIPFTLSENVQVNPQNAKFAKDDRGQLVAKAIWKAEWMPDGIAGILGTPEYIFGAKISRLSETQKEIFIYSSHELSVSKK